MFNAMSSIDNVLSTKISKEHSTTLPASSVEVIVTVVVLRFLNIHYFLIFSYLRYDLRSDVLLHNDLKESLLWRS